MYFKGHGFKTSNKLNVLINLNNSNLIEFRTKKKLTSFTEQREVRYIQTLALKFSTNCYRCEVGIIILVKTSRDFS